MDIRSNIFAHNNIDKHLACTACGVIIQGDDASSNLYCPRCRSKVRRKSFSINFSIAMALSGLICFFPAIFFPILTFKIGIVEQPNNMLSALHYFYEDGYPLLSVVVFVTTILAPFVQMVLFLLLFIPLTNGKRPRFMKPLYKLLYEIRHWVMLDVYVIAILVSIIKLTPISDLIYETGLVMFVTLSVFSSILSYSFSPRQIWRAYAHAQ